MPVLLRISGLARSTFFYHQARQDRQDKFALVKEQILAVNQKARGRYGHRRIHHELVKLGYRVAKKTVLALMRVLGIRCRVRARRKYSSYQGLAGRIAPNVLDRDFHASKPDQKWVTDVTQFQLAGQRLYLSPIIDLYDHSVIAHSISTAPTTAFTNESLLKAMAARHDTGELIVHTDQGFHYQHLSWRRILAANHATQSMSRKGNCYDNSLAENFFGHLKSELFLDGMPATLDELETEIADYITWYNNERIQERLEGMTPNQYRNHALQHRKTTTI